MDVYVGYGVQVSAVNGRLSPEQALKLLGQRVDFVKNFLLFGAKAVQEHKTLVAFVCVALGLWQRQIEHKDSKF
ncbi:hypothetical protein BpHYR1_006225 [Brachionus plicatilis]|uniref:Uncharacterized protein n=1 Tax=Brachionus plicatilis TaxID=10195 RepID=A0A3M7S881_BRAPC|nr:hypothetical protein BpHYR1_006225 [Brachionus plicatilis]